MMPASELGELLDRVGVCDPMLLAKSLTALPTPESLIFRQLPHAAAATIALGLWVRFEMPEVIEAGKLFAKLAALIVLSLSC